MEEQSKKKRPLSKKGSRKGGAKLERQGEDAESSFATAAQSSSIMEDTDDEVI